MSNRPEVPPQIGYLALQKLKNYSMELGPIRPPSEAFSLLIRATRNCPWNRCDFCRTYKGQRFELRPVEDIKKDIQTARSIHDEVKGIAFMSGYPDQLHQVAGVIADRYAVSAGVRNVALWMYGGNGNAFLQDANTLIMRTPELIEVLHYLKETFPVISRVTSYGRSHTAARKSAQELQDIHAAGLSRLHIGMESGSDDVLKLVNKGVTGEQQIEGGRRVVAAGISLSEYVMPGLGGRKLSKQHVDETARVLNAVVPDFIRIRSLHVGDDMPLYQKVQRGELELMSEDEVVEEIGSLIQKLDCHSTFASDHMMNILQEVEGRLPDDKPRLLEVIDRYLALPASERLFFRFGRRAGLFMKLSDLQDVSKRRRLEEAKLRLKLNTDTDIEAAISQFRRRFI